jgi:chromosome partitioning protein
MSSIAVYSPKGGVGKSTCAVNLAYLSATTSKRRTLLWDIDAQGASGYLLGVRPLHCDAHKIFSRAVDPADLAQATPYRQLSVLTADPSLRRLDVQLVEADARRRIRKLIRSLETRVERIVLDCPPGLTEISEQIFRAVDLIVFPVAPSALGMRTYDEVVAHLAKQGDGPAVLPLLSMVDMRRKAHRQLVADHPDWPVLPYASAVERMSAERAPLAAFAPRHPATGAFADVWAQVEQRLAVPERALSR